MKLRAPVALAGVVAMTVLAASCGQVPGEPAQAPAGPSPVPVPAPVVQRVVVSAPAGLGPTFTIGQTLQLAATAEYSDGHSAPCTASATWTSTNDIVAKTSSRPGEVAMLTFGDAAVMATCGGIAGSLPLSVTRGIRIEGLEDDVPFALTSMDQQLRAYLVEGPGHAKECTEEGRWRTADPAIADISPHDPGWLRPHNAGETIVTVTCEDATGSVVVRVGYYNINLQILDSETGAPVPDVAVVRSSSRTDAAGRFSTRANQEREELWFWKLGFDPFDADVLWNRELTMDVIYPMTPVPGIFLQGSAQVCGNAHRPCGQGKPPFEQVHAFQVPHAGTLRVDAIFSAGGLYDTLDYELRIRQSYFGTLGYEYAISVR